MGLQPQRVGRFEMTIIHGGPSPGTADRWAQRVEMLCSWLLGEWNGQQREGPRQIERVHDE